MKHLYDAEPAYTAYSNDDRIIIYKRVLKYMLEDIAKDDVHGLCHYMIRSCCYLMAMQSVIILRKNFWSEESIEESPFPELMKYKPATNVNSHGSPGGVFWFALDEVGMKRRVEIITEILTNLRAES